MTLNVPKPSPALICVVCGTEATAIKKFEGRKVCDDCAEMGHDGSDGTTLAVKLQINSQRDKAQIVRSKYNGGEVDEMLEDKAAG
ncbi:hypothetical protein HC248_01931 [Polaromonas vacuolata]|uniref:Uncharacterized protein n=1 Tax=Polaromonas vacuolata TaxID=37448 RepID=A0A6H2HA00_9BURK|nr:hypothetical protein [Polaromonas vacuolata]QJC56623.1 hypothetical protein HC248_01931 [Polaromonas vacuolata]